jgi:hypothetical protein
VSLRVLLISDWSYADCCSDARLIRDRWLMLWLHEVEQGVKRVHVISIGHFAY